MNESPEDRREMSLMAKLSLPEEHEPPWSLLSAGLILFAMFICLTVIGPALVAIMSGGEVLLPSELTLSWAIGMALTIVFAIVNRRSSQESWRALRLRRGGTPWPIALLSGVAIALGIDLIVSLASGQFLPAPAIYGFQSRGAAGLLVAASLLILLQPLAETLVFQAVVLPSLRWKLGAWSGVIATTALFVALHASVFWAAQGAIYPAFWHGIVYPTLLGSAFSLLKVYTGSSGAALIGRMGAGLIFFLTALALFGG